MYYLSRSSVPVPADAPYAANLNERKEWDYHQHKHQEALKKVSGLVDKSKPKCIDPPVQSIQARTRRFQEDWKKAEIGRENRKLVNKLHTIAKTHGSCGPPPQAAGGMPSAAVALLGTTGRTLRPSAAAACIPPAGERSRSLNDNYRRKVQRTIDQDNAGMVRRILSVKATFDPKKDERDFQRHKRAVNLLQRLPDRKRNPRSLPPLRPQRSNSNPATERNLKALIFPGDLQRSESGPGALEWRTPAAEGGVDAFPRSSSEGHARTAPLSSEDMDTASSPSAAPAPAASDAADASPLGFGGPMSPGATGPDNEKRQAMQRQATGSAFPHQSDSATKRRQWIPGQEESPKEEDPLPRKDAASGAGQKVGISLLTGMSSESELQYADDWDEDSFTGTSSASGQPSRGPSTSNMASSNGGAQLGGTGIGMGSSSAGGRAGAAGGVGGAAATGSLGSSTGGGLGGPARGGRRAGGGRGGLGGGLGGTTSTSGLGSGGFGNTG